MPLHGSNLQLDASRYFDSYFHTVIKPTKLELEKLIAKKKATLKFIDSIYKQTFDATRDTPFNDYILETISKYENDNDEKLLYAKSAYFVFDTDGYFIETKEGNHRNWIYSCEIETAYTTLKQQIKNLE